MDLKKKCDRPTYLQTYIRTHKDIHTDIAIHRGAPLLKTCMKKQLKLWV